MMRKEAARRGERDCKEIRHVQRYGGSYGALSAKVRCFLLHNHVLVVRFLRAQVAFLRPERSKRRLYFFRSDNWARTLFAAPAYTSSAK
jgi:hypothetical protein